MGAIQCMIVTYGPPCLRTYLRRRNTYTNINISVKCVQKILISRTGIALCDNGNTAIGMSFHYWLKCCYTIDWKAVYSNRYVQDIISNLLGTTTWWLGSQKLEDLSSFPGIAFLYQKELGIWVVFMLEEYIYITICVLYYNVQLSVPLDWFVNRLGVRLTHISNIWYIRQQTHPSHLEHPILAILEYLLGMDHPYRLWYILSKVLSAPV